MKKEALLGIVLLLILVLTIAYTKQEGVDYFPMSDGARWEYSLEVLKMDKTGNVVKEGEKIIYLIYGEKTIKGKRYYKQAFISRVPGSGKEVTYYRKEKGGVYFIMEGDEDKPESLLVPLPPEVGKTWTTESIFGENKYNILERFVVDGKETLSLQDRKYENCLKISSKSTLKDKPELQVFETVYYYAPNVGLMKKTITTDLETNNKDKTVMQFTLTKYEH